jgi:hypothetical protein
VTSQGHSQDERWSTQIGNCGSVRCQFTANSFLNLAFISVPSATDFFCFSPGLRASVASFCRQMLVKLSFFRHAGMIGGLKICILILEESLAAIPFL